MTVVIEELKERITDIAVKGRRYQGREIARDKKDYLETIEGSFIRN